MLAQLILVLFLLEGHVVIDDTSTTGPHVTNAGLVCQFILKIVLQPELCQHPFLQQLVVQM
jgi:hypothetical protein